MKKLCKRAMSKEKNFFKNIDLTPWFVTQGQKKVEYIWVPEIMIDDQVHKGHTK